MKDALDLQTRIRGLRALLELQRRQIEMINDRLQPTRPGAIAAARLLALKEEGPRDPSR